jgi:hypothetical protein
MEKPTGVREDEELKIGCEEVLLDDPKLYSFS